MPGGVSMCWAVLAFFAFVIWTLTTKTETAVALALVPLWFVTLTGGWLMVRRRAVSVHGIVDGSISGERSVLP